VRDDLKTVRAYLKVQALHLLWEYTSPAFRGWAGKFLDAWCRDVMRSRIEPLKKVVRSLRAHRPLILNSLRGEEAIQRGDRGGVEREREVGVQKSVRLPDVQSGGSGVISPAWPPAGTADRPQILLRRQKC